jgi:hypothetical protein
MPWAPSSPTASSTSTPATRSPGSSTATAASRARRARRGARAPLALARARAAWTVWDGAAWSQDLTAGVPVLHGAPGDLSVSWNAHLGAYLAVHSVIFADDVVFHTAPRPEGPWTGARHLFVGAHVDGTNDYAGKEHPELATDGGRGLVVTYAHPEGGFDEDVRVATPTLP